MELSLVEHLGVDDLAGFLGLAEIGPSSCIRGTPVYTIDCPFWVQDESTFG